MLLFQRRHFILFAIVFANFLGATVVTPILPLYARREFDASPDTITLLLASFFVAQFLAAPVLGRLSDRYGRLPILVISQIGTCLSFVILASAGSIPMLFAGRILDGITGGNVIVAQAYVTDITPREKRTQGLGLIFAAFGLGYMIGPGLGGLIAAVANEHATIWVGAACSLATVILTVLFLDESLPAEQRRARTARTSMRAATVLGNSALLLCLLIGFAAQASIALLQGTISLYADSTLFAGQSRSAVNLGVGLMLTGIGVGQFITQIAFLRPLIRRFGERRLVIIGAFLRGLGILSVVFFGSPVLVGAVSLVLVAVASGIMMPSLQSLTTTTASEDISGGVLGVYNASVTLGLITGTYLGGVLYRLEPGLPFIVGGLLLWATMPFGLMLYRRTHSPSERAPAPPGRAAHEPAAQGAD
jgi:DHA1 family tetracycline resistance protein-like MFS transporter